LELDDGYFTQTLLPSYMLSHPETTAAWDVVYDARGHFEEPHTEVIVPLGTLDVRAYLAELGSHGDSKTRWTASSWSYRTRGPLDRFSAVLFLEKEGFWPLFKAVNLAKRYDIAIMSTKGLSNTASRMLVDWLCVEILLLMARDFDKPGFSVAGTLPRSNWRYTFRNKIRSVDIGLRLEDVKEWGLESERVSYGGKDITRSLVQNGATPAEIAFLKAGRRVELNAFTSADLVRWIERKLEEHGVKKVIPGQNTLENAFRQAAEKHILDQELEGMRRKAHDLSQAVPIPDHLDASVRKRQEEDHILAWDDAVAELAAKRVSEETTRLDSSSAS
jgi:hypothetical protein